MPRLRRDLRDRTIERRNIPWHRAPAASKGRFGIIAGRRPTTRRSMGAPIERGGGLRPTRARIKPRRFYRGPRRTRSATGRSSAPRPRLSRCRDRAASPTPSKRHPEPSCRRTLGRLREAERKGRPRTPEGPHRARHPGRAVHYLRPMRRRRHAALHSSARSAGLVPKVRRCNLGRRGYRCGDSSAQFGRAAGQRRAPRSAATVAATSDHPGRHSRSEATRRRALVDFRRRRTASASRSVRPTSLMT